MPDEPREDSTKLPAKIYFGGLSGIIVAAIAAPALATAAAWVALGGMVSAIGAMIYDKGRDRGRKDEKLLQYTLFEPNNDTPAHDESDSDLYDDVPHSEIRYTFRDILIAPDRIRSVVFRHDIRDHYAGVFETQTYQLKPGSYIVTKKGIVDIVQFELMYFYGRQCENIKIEVRHAFGKIRIGYSMREIYDTVSSKAIPCMSEYLPDENCLILMCTKPNQEFRCYIYGKDDGK